MAITRKKKRKGCRNCEHGGIIRFGSWKFPVVHCDLDTDDSSVWSGVCDFHHCCNKHEWRLNRNAGLKCDES